ncbi:6791_t:CDS:2 [Gigaspora margarita]|uniref:6791_t:CDS:1 n=1 Tax=Gigaspora margarita TaxID=4874 RepID=A0ABN7V8Z3_GIGMA|nr:6791_t:CDS:2 [Gigaspora margarita]
MSFQNLYNSLSYLEWRCTKGHEWTASFSSIKYQRSWCPYCAGNIRYTLETAKLVAFNKGQAKNTLYIAKIVAINKGGDCISNKYINGSSHLRWKCAKGHEWNATLENVKNRDSWCPICAGPLRMCKILRRNAMGTVFRTVIKMRILN